VVAVTVDRADQIVVTGELEYAGNVLGEVMVSEVDWDLELWKSGFVAKLGADGSVAWTAHLNAVEAIADVATDAAGNVVVSGATLGNPASPMLTRLSAAGSVGFASGGSRDGAGHGVATDACGNVYQVITTRDPAVGWVASVRKLAFSTASSEGVAALRSRP